jgi:predicted cupin superfamily sugar epimerase
MLTADELIGLHGLKRHPEGGYFAETYRASESIARGALPPRYDGDRSFCTAIYFLLPQGAKSQLHRVESDEIWHFYLGGALTLFELHEDGRVEKTRLGSDFAIGERAQHVVKRGVWFGALPDPGVPYSFVGCTVAPGFDFADFELARRSELLARHPAARETIELLTAP